MTNEPLKSLFTADPELAGNVLRILKSKGAIIPEKYLEMLVEESFRGMHQEISFGYAIALGLARLMGENKISRVEIYRDIIRKTSKKGPTLGVMMAKHLPPVLIHGTEKLLSKFLSTVSIMESKGTYTLKNCLELHSELLNSKQQAAAVSFLDILASTFSQDITYNQSLHLSHILPDAVRKFKQESRIWLLPLLTRVIKADISLIESFLEGFEKKLKLLSPEALDHFVETGLKKLDQSKKSASKFMSLESSLGKEIFNDLQVTVSFAQVRQQLNQYLQARTSVHLSVKPLSDLTDRKFKTDENTASVLSDGQYIYLPETIGIYSTKEKNINLYKCLTKLEAGLYEFGTFDFDMEKLEFITGFSLKPANRQGADLRQFFAGFFLSSLAQDLFTVFEHGRIRFLMKQKYPGIIRRTRPFMEDEINRLSTQKESSSPLFYLYRKIAAEQLPDPNINPDQRKRLDHIAAVFDEKVSQNSEVETSASLVLEFYPLMENLFTQREQQKFASGNKNDHLKPATGMEDKTPQQRSISYNSFPFPFYRKIHPELYFSTFNQYESLAEKIKEVLQKQNIRVFKSDIRKQLIKKGGRLRLDDLKEMLSLSAPEQDHHGKRKIPIDPEALDLNGLIETSHTSEIVQPDFAGSVFLYREWDCRLGDYIHDHVRVLDRFMEKDKGGFYQQTLSCHRGLVSRIRYAFELLKPERLKILRPWVEGDDFDYRAMLDFAIDKKAGWLPSERLYIKRLKQQRDVAVLLLVDLSKSTSNAVFESTQTVLDVEKEAIILLCEALEVLGDKWAIAGFSGTGRLGVDYYRIKDFSEPLNDNVKWRINAMSPRRNTRMGAAIRHGLKELEKVDAMVRLMILLGDGFPNDLDYKRDYAIEDTRKAASEAFAKNIPFRAITVNIANDCRLDDLYGDVHHTVISEVRELPDKLLRIYSALTKY